MPHWRSLAACLIGLCIAALAGCASPPLASNTKGAAAPATAAEYRIGAGDGLNLFVWNHPELSVTVPVRPDGRITAPLIDDVVAAGKTTAQLSRELETRLAEYVRSPKVSIIVTAATGNYGDQVRVIGQAAHPQALPYRNGMTLLDVMIAVGGLAEFAAGNRATLTRTVDGKAVQMRVRLKDLINDGDITANVPIQPGDVLVIPESRF